MEQEEHGCMAEEAGEEAQGVVAGNGNRNVPPGEADGREESW